MEMTAMPRAANDDVTRRTRVKAKKKADPVQSGNVVQWTVKGVDREILELSRQAARKRGMKFGAWVAQALHSAATEEAEKENAHAAQLISRIMEIEAKIESSINELKTQGSGIQHDVRVLQLLMPRPL